MEWRLFSHTLLCRTFWSLVLVTCLCLTLPSQHSPARTSRNRMWGQCPVGNKAPDLGTGQSLPCLQAPVRADTYSWGDGGFPLCHHCKGITPLTSSREHKHGTAPRVLLCPTVRSCPAVPGPHSTLTLPGVPRKLLSEMGLATGDSKLLRAENPHV